MSLLRNIALLIFIGAILVYLVAENGKQTLLSSVNKVSNLTEKTVSAQKNEEIKPEQVQENVKQEEEWVGCRIPPETKVVDLEELRQRQMVEKEARERILENSCNEQGGCEAEVEPTEDAVEGKSLDRELSEEQEVEPEQQGTEFQEEEGNEHREEEEIEPFCILQSLQQTIIRIIL